MAASWHLVAQDLTTALLDLAECDRTSVAFAAAHRAQQALAQVAAQWIGLAPITPGGQTLAELVTSTSAWADQVAAAERSLPALLDGPLSALIDGVDAVRTNPHLIDALDRLAAPEPA